jgi:hypothetical protein
MLMNVVERLDCVRQEFPECQMVAYADISTNMILSTSATMELRQEHLDSLCDTAVDMLRGQSSSHLRAALGGCDDTGIFQVIIVEPTEINVFLRSTTSSIEALFCICTPLINLDKFIARVRNHLDEIGLGK